MFEKARRLGTGAARITLDDNECRKIVGIIAADLGVDEERLTQPSELPDFYSTEFGDWQSGGLAGIEAFEALVDTVTDGELFFYCLAAIHLRRLKYRRILAAQPLPTLEQVGPRALLQYGLAPPLHLAALLFWRKWIYDIDNRAAQETGYIFEPIIAASIGGVPYSDKKSPVRRRSGKGSRQVDCLRGNDAYELKLRVTIAASGQGRWDAELEKYVRRPLESLLDDAPPMDDLPPLSLRQEDGFIVVRLGDFEMRIERTAEELDLEDDDGLPDDVDEELPGV